MSVKDREVPRKCLGIALDHRLRRELSQLGPAQQSRSSGECLEELLKIYDRVYRNSGAVNNHEYGITAQLLRWYMFGGVIALLKQPANNHPFKDGLKAVTESCPTLAALRETEEVITGLQGEMSILDSLPFTRSHTPIADAQRKAIKSSVMGILRAKQPRAILCMWQDDTTASGDLDAFKSKGVGKTFDSSKCNDEIGNPCSKVNVFHPSYMLRYGPDISCFRQLFVLEITQAFAICAGNWREKPWMENLRSSCQKKACEVGSRSRGADIRSRDVSVADVVASLERSLKNMENIIEQLAVNGPRSCAKDRYSKLVHYGLTPLCNDANLCLQWLARRRSYSTQSTASQEHIAYESAKGLISKFLVRTFKRYRGRKPLIRRKVIELGISYCDSAVINELRRDESSALGQLWYGLDCLPKLMQQLTQQMNSITKLYCEGRNLRTYLLNTSLCFLQCAVQYEDLLESLSKEEPHLEEQRDWLSLQVEELGDQLGQLDFDFNACVCVRSG